MWVTVGGLIVSQCALVLDICCLWLYWYDFGCSLVAVSSLILSVLLWFTFITLILCVLHYYFEFLYDVLGLVAAGVLFVCFCLLVWVLRWCLLVWAVLL